MINNSSTIAISELTVMSDYVEDIQHNTVNLPENAFQQSSELQLQLSDTVSITS